MSEDNKINKQYNPSDYDRYNMIVNELKKENRIEDLENIISLMNPPKEIRSICTSDLGKNIKIAIVGGGLAGLAAAFELKKIGCNITIFETSKRIGGRTYTYYFDRGINKYGDFGEFRIPISHYTTWHYINLFKLDTEIFNNDVKYYYLRNNGGYNTEDEIYNNIYSQYNLTKDDKEKLNKKSNIITLDKYLKYLTEEERKDLISIKKGYCDKILELDKLSLKRAYENEGFSEDSISMIGYLLGNKEYFEYSLLEYLAKKYTLDSTNNYTIKGGMIKLPFALYEANINNKSKIYKDINCDDLGVVDFKLGTMIEEISSVEGKKISLEYRDLENNKVNKENFDFLIYTEPVRNLKRVKIYEKLSYEKIRAIDEISIVNSQKIYLYLKERFWEKEKYIKDLSGGRIITDLPLYSIYYPTNINNNDFKTPCVLIASELFADKTNNVFCNLDEKMKIEDTIKYLELIHKLPQGYLESILIDYNCLSWMDIKYSWGYSTIFKPEEKKLYSYGISKAEINNRMFFAGENYSVKHGTQQGELQSGMIAANNVAEEIVRKAEENT